MVQQAEHLPGNHHVVQMLLAGWPFHGGNTGSIPVGRASNFNGLGLLAIALNGALGSFWGVNVAEHWRTPMENKMAAYLPWSYPKAAQWMILQMDRGEMVQRSCSQRVRYRDGGSIPSRARSKESDAHAGFVQPDW